MKINKNIIKLISLFADITRKKNINIKVYNIFNKDQPISKNEILHQM